MSMKIILTEFLTELKLNQGIIIAYIIMVKQTFLLNHLK